MSSVARLYSAEGIHGSIPSDVEILGDIGMEFAFSCEVGAYFVYDDEFMN